MLRKIKSSLLFPLCWCNKLSSLYWLNPHIFIWDHHYPCHSTDVGIMMSYFANYQLQIIITELADKEISFRENFQCSFCPIWPKKKKKYKILHIIFTSLTVPFAQLSWMAWDGKMAKPRQEPSKKIRQTLRQSPVPSVGQIQGFTHITQSPW